MILCKQCNAVRHSDAAPCDKCGVYMTVTERAAATLHIPERQFFENVLLEINEARRMFPVNRNLLQAVILYASSLQPAIDRDANIRLHLIQLVALATRLYVEGDQDYITTLPTSDDPLADLETQLKGL